MILYMVGGVAALLFVVSLLPGIFGRILADLAEIALRIGSLAMTITVIAFVAYVSMKMRG